jgi:hypothetical protein
MLKTSASTAAAGHGSARARHGLVAPGPRAVPAAHPRPVKSAGPQGGAGNLPSTATGAAPSAAQVAQRTRGAQGHAANSRLYLGKKAVVIGAGPVGITAAMFLVQQGFAVTVSRGAAGPLPAPPRLPARPPALPPAAAAAARPPGQQPARSAPAHAAAPARRRVQVHDRRPEPHKDAFDAGQGYSMVLPPNSQDALRELGVPLPTSNPSYVSLGTVFHDPSGRVAVTEESGNIAFSRWGGAGVHWRPLPAPGTGACTGACCRRRHWRVHWRPLLLRSSAAPASWQPPQPWVQAAPPAPPPARAAGRS